MSTPEGRIFSSWKEIAAFLGKGVRTVQRWEKTLGLPIRRPNGTTSNIVVATESDLRRWIFAGAEKSRNRQTEPNAIRVRELESQLTRLEQVHIRLDKALERVQSRFTLIENSFRAKQAFENATVHTRRIRRSETDTSMRNKSDKRSKTSDSAAGNSSLGSS